MARLVRSGADYRRRVKYIELTRHLCTLSIAREPSCPWPAQLARLEAGERVVVAGWEVDQAQDFSQYWLEPDGHLEPVGPTPRKDTR